MDILLAPFWSSAEQRLRSLWRIIMMMLVFVIVQLLGVLLVRFIGAGGFVTIVIGTGVSMLVAGLVLDRRRFIDFGFHLDRNWWLDLGFGLALGALLMSGIFLVELAAGWITVIGAFATQDPDQLFILAILQPFVIFLCVGIYEEMQFRGYIMRNMAEGLNVGLLTPRGSLVLAWLLSSVLFGLAHAANPNTTLISTLNLMLAGVFLGLGYVLTGELAIPIGLHITWNFFQGNVFGFPVSGGLFNQATFIAIEQGGPARWTGGAFGPEAGLLGIIAIILGTLLTLVWVRARYGHVSLIAALATYPGGR